MGRPGSGHHTEGKILKKEPIYLLGKGEGKIQKEKKHTHSYSNNFCQTYISIFYHVGEQIKVCMWKCSDKWSCLRIYLISVFQIIVSKYPEQGL